MPMLTDLRREFFVRSDTGALPARVRDAIGRQQDRSETLIGWFQLFVVATLGTLYAISPKPPLMFDLVPWALGIYFLLTVIRLVWSRLARLPSWALALSVVLDMTLLMALIWSFHLKYEQPASFYLKAPTMLYVFIFIALRALRFEARYVLLAGLAAAVGWGGLMAYVLLADPHDAMITRDFVTYMTSNSILLGAEFDKIISIMMVTLIIAVALVRAKGLLVRAVAEQSAARDLSRFFDPQIAQRITGAEQQILAGSGELRDAAIVNLDMRGFTRLAERHPPDQVIGLLAEYQSIMVPIIQSHGGSIDKFMGDGILTTFGASAPSETYAADALRAIDAVIQAAAAWQEGRSAAGDPAPAVNAAAATGRILFGAVGDETRLEYTVIGDAVNLSAKLEKANKDHSVRAICDAATYDQALAQGYTPPVPHRRLPGGKVAGVENALDLVVLAE
ncbi:MAG: adenylate/guanylate cyclase domain-containing protein [Kiloniellales bacterium]